METQDFSFPKISDTCAYSIDSPPLWNLSPTATASSNNPYQVLTEKKKGDENDCFEEKLVSNSKGQMKSFSCVQNGNKITGLENEEVPMDLLWEAFNEEVSSTTRFSTSSSREMVEFRCAAALTISKTNGGALLQTKNRPSMMVMVKVLKKIFSHNISHGKPKRRVL